MPGPVELKVFGAPVVVVAGRERPLPLQRAQALLGYLALHAGPVPRSHLATLLWPDADERTGRTRLRRLVYTVEHTLGRPMFAAHEDRLALQGVDADLPAFARFARTAVAAGALADEPLAQARAWLAAARQPLLQGVGFGSQAFDDWLQATTLEHRHLLARLLERVAEALAQRGDFGEAQAAAESLLALDPYREPSHVLLMELQARQGHAAGVEAAYARCAELLRAEFGIPPGAATEQAYQRLGDGLRRPAAPHAAPPALRFAEGDGGTVAYTVLGEGERTLVLAPGFVCHIEIALELPAFRAFVESLARRFRVVLFDRRGLGLSERLRAVPTPAAMAADIAAILDHAGVAAAWVFGSSEGGMGALQLAATQPQRVQGLCLFGALARGSQAPDYPWALPAPAYDAWLKRLLAGWGGPVGIETFAPGEQHDPALRAWWARLVHQAASPGGLQAVLGGLRDADLRPKLPHIRVPTLVMHRRGDLAVRFDAGRHLAQSIPGAVWQALEGTDHFWWCGDRTPVLQAIERFTAR